jgi:hypothetical protein
VGRILSGQSLRKSGRRETQVLHQPTPVNSAELIEDDEPLLLLKATRDTEWVGATARGHWRDNKRAQVVVQLVR